MKTAMAAALAKALRGCRSRASLLHLHGGGRGMPQEGRGATPFLPRLGATTVPPPAAAARGMGGSGASSQSLMQAAGRRMPQEGGLASLLPRLGATVPPPAAAGMGSGASSLSLLQTAGRRMPWKGGLAPPPPRLGAMVPFAMPWQFHQMAGLRSSAEAGKQISPASSLSLSKEYVTGVQNLHKMVEDMEASIKFLENLLWTIAFLVLFAAFTLPKPMVSLWARNSQLSRKLQARKERAKRLEEEVSHLQDILNESKRSAAGTPMAPTPVLPAAAPVPSTAAPDL